MNAKSPPAPEPSAPLPRVWTPLDLINWTKSFFEKKGLEHPRLEAELLLAEVLGCARIRLYVDFEKPVSAEHLATFREYIKRRAEKREPIQYILGHTQFIHLQIKVTPAVLIPRPETEILAVWAAEKLQHFQSAGAATSGAEGPRALDLCTGSGCLALYLASRIAAAQVVATDLSGEALAVARENAAALKLEARVQFLEGDLFGALLTASGHEPFDVIVTNPPYIDENARATLQPEVRDFEPAMALFAGDGGTAISRRIILESGPWLKPGGLLGLEFGAGQEQIIQEIAAASGYFDDIHIEKDGSKLPRFLIAKKRRM